MVQFVQINLKKSFVAAVELNKTVKTFESYIIAATETYNFRGKIRSAPPRSKTISHSENPRAALIFGS